MDGRLLVVDDEESIVELLKFNLEREGFRVDTAMDGFTALQMAEANEYDLIILDLMLPRMDGIQVCQKIRAKSSVPILMLTAKDEEVDKIVGLSVGADDYMTKPFSTRELVARVKALLRRRSLDLEAFSRGAADGETTARHGADRADETAEEKPGRLIAGELVLDEESFEVTVGGVPQDFTRKEFELLKVLMSNKGKVLTREFLLEKVWGYDYTGDTRTVDVHIRRLRQKIEPDDKEPYYIQTVHGVGYKFRGDV